MDDAVFDVGEPALSRRVSGVGRRGRCGEHRLEVGQTRTQGEIVPQWTRVVVSGVTPPAKEWKDWGSAKSVGEGRGSVYRGWGWCPPGRGRWVPPRRGWCTRGGTEVLKDAYYPTLALQGRETAENLDDLLPVSDGRGGRTGRLHSRRPDRSQRVRHLTRPQSPFGRPRTQRHDSSFRSHTPATPRTGGEPMRE